MNKYNINKYIWFFATICFIIAIFFNLMNGTTSLVLYILLGITIAATSANAAIFHQLSKNKELSRVLKIQILIITTMITIVFLTFIYLANMKRLPFIDLRYVNILVIVLVIINFALKYKDQPRKSWILTLILWLLALSIYVVSIIAIPNVRQPLKDCSHYPNSISDYYGIVEKIEPNGTDNESAKITVSKVNKEEERYCTLKEDVQLDYSGKSMRVLIDYKQNGGNLPGLGEIRNHFVVGATITFSLNQYDIKTNTYIIDDLSLLKPAEAFKKK